jgi:alkanesulfonate monooxygenase SsuD/methylene tetrahydromethanopterin reductase-like flavin-dependent oxidoreductase (luciferase family)
MKVDLELNSAAHYAPRDIVALAPLAEEAGFSGLWKGEANNADTIVVLSAVAPATRRLQLGTSISHVHSRSPVALGIAAATLQDLSGGRFIVGVGVANRAMAAWHGGTFDRPLTRAREYIEIVRLVAAGERVEYEGEIYSTGKRFQLSWTPRYPRVPVYLAALGPKMSELAGRIADGVVINMGTPAVIERIAERVRAGALASGRDPASIEIAVKVRVSVHPDRATARRRLREALTFYNVADHYRDMLKDAGFGTEVDAIGEAFKARGFKAAVAQLTDDYMDRLPVIAATSIDEVRERLQPYIAAGTTRLHLPYVPVSDPPEEDAHRFLTAWRDSDSRAGVY